MYVVNMLLFPNENYGKQIYFDKRWYGKCKYPEYSPGKCFHKSSLN